MNLDELCRPKPDCYDPLFGRGFEERLTPDYQVLLQLGHDTIQCMGSAVRGFHFSLDDTDTIHPTGGELYLFPRKPTNQQLEEIAVLTATAPGWARRGKEITPQYPMTVFCYEIHPSYKAAKTQVEACRIAYFSSTALGAIEVHADDTLEWEVKDRKNIIVTKDGATLS